MRPTPSSTEAIIAARSRTSSGVPAASAARIAWFSGSAFSLNASSHAGLLRTTSSGASMFGRFGNSQPL